MTRESDKPINGICKIRSYFLTGGSGDAGCRENGKKTCLNAVGHLLLRGWKLSRNHQGVNFLLGANGTK